MKALIVHNSYSSAQPSGENGVVERDIEELAQQGVEVSVYRRSSDEIADMRLRNQIGLPIRPTYSIEDVRRLGRKIDEVQPDVMHVHNLFPLISPAVISLAKRRGVRVLQTVHNYRHSCMSGVLYRGGDLCEDCVGRKLPVPAVLHGCYRGSRAQSAAMVFSAAVHRRTWHSVDLFLPVSRFVADRLRAFGVDERQILVRPNSVAFPSDVPEVSSTDVAFIGRMAPEKGIRLLLDAWGRAGAGSSHLLHVAGEGPLRSFVERERDLDGSIVYHGLLDEDGVNKLIQSVGLVVVPSTWPEPDPLIAVRAQAWGRALLGTDRGALGTYITPEFGWIVPPDVDQMANVIQTALADEKELKRRGRNARACFLETRARQTKLSDIYAALVSGRLDSLTAT